MDLANLRVSIKPHIVPLPNYALNIDLTVYNPFDHPVTIQTWDSPLDSRCALLGIIEIFDIVTNELLPIDRVYFSRQLPPPPESFIQIESHQQATNSVSIPGIRLEPEKEYHFKAQGTWKAVWDKSITSINAQSLQSLGGAYGGDFSSDAVVVKPESSENMADRT